MKVDIDLLFDTRSDKIPAFYREFQWWRCHKRKPCFVWRIIALQYGRKTVVGIFLANTTLGWLSRTVTYKCESRQPSSLFGSRQQPVHVIARRIFVSEFSHVCSRSVYYHFISPLIIFAGSAGRRDDSTKHSLRFAILSSSCLERTP